MKHRLRPLDRAIDARDRMWWQGKRRRTRQDGCYLVRTGHGHTLLCRHVMALELFVAKRPVFGNAIARAQAEIARMHPRTRTEPAIRAAA
jgi:hypothetical protein